MTEASKARKRHPMRIIHGPPMDPGERANVLRALSEMRGTLVLPPGARLEVIYPRRPLRSKPPVSLPVPVSCRAGVGGRRKRARRRREERRGKWAAAKPGLWKTLAMRYLFKRDSVRDPVR